MVILFIPKNSPEYFSFKELSYDHTFLFKNYYI